MDYVKRCPKCKIYKPKSEFFKDKSRKSGLQCYCKNCRLVLLKKWQKENKELCRSYVRKHYDKKRKLYVKYKKSLKCQKCGENHFACLEFHHKNPKEKEFGIGHSFLNKSMKQMINEIAKCDVLCANCHKKLHYIKH